MKNAKIRIFCFLPRASGHGVTTCAIQQFPITCSALAKRLTPQLVLTITIMSMKKYCIFSLSFNLESFRMRKYPFQVLTFKDPQKLQSRNGIYVKFSKTHRPKFSLIPPNEVFYITHYKFFHTWGEPPLPPHSNKIGLRQSKFSGHNWCSLWLPIPPSL